MTEITSLLHKERSTARRVGPRLTQQQLEAHLWGAANILRGKTAGQDYKNYILSLMFYKRLCDQWEHEADEAIAELERQQGRTFTEKQRAVFRARGEHRFSIPDGARWGDVKAASTDIGAVLTTAMRQVASANDELRGVFTVDWNQPAPDGSGKLLIPNEVVHALVQHFEEHDLSNSSVTPDVLGRAYEYLIKQFADDAGAKAGEFFTPPEVVDVLVRMLEPRPGDTVYDPTCGSGGMLVHSADHLREQGHHATSAQYFGQEMNWGNAAIGKINSVLHGLEADIRAGASTITDPQFLEVGGGLRRFSMVLANFPFSDDFWWLRPEQQTDDKKKRVRLKNEIFGKEGYKDAYGRFGRGTPYHAPPAGYGDYAFVLHILNSLNDDGRAGVVCPQGVLFRGQPEVEEETGEFTGEGAPILRRRKPDDEYLIRKALLDARYIDAVIALPLNVFYGAGIPACLLVLRKDRPRSRRDKVLVVYAGRHFRELSNQNQLRPQDVMRILVHYHAYGDSAAAAPLVDRYSGLIRTQIDSREADDVGLLLVQYAPDEEALRLLRHQLSDAEADRDGAKTAAAARAATTRIGRIEKQRQRLVRRLADRDQQIEEARRKAEEDRDDLRRVESELGSLYLTESELVKHVRLVDFDEVVDNEFNLNVPRYVDTFEPENMINPTDAAEALNDAQTTLAESQARLISTLQRLGIGP